MENLRFKFRGYWYNEVQEEWWVFDEPEFITGDGTAEIWSNSESGAYPELPSDAELHLCQCTGLKDKNGKLVYEGDIVNYDDRDLDPSHKPILNAVIELRKYQWCMVYYRKDIIDAHTRKPAKRKTWLGFDHFISSRIEVIGNIYKNKELLER